VDRGWHIPDIESVQHCYLRVSIWVLPVHLLTACCWAMSWSKGQLLWRLLHCLGFTRSDKLHAYALGVQCNWRP
jgi:hypothetical protein